MEIKLCQGTLRVAGNVDMVVRLMMVIETQRDQVFFFRKPAFFDGNNVMNDYARFAANIA